jgi:hypothetical protein
MDPHRKDAPTLEAMITDTGAPPEPGHDEWVRRQVQRTLNDKKAGKLEYYDFGEIAEEFGFFDRHPDWRPR